MKNLKIKYATISECGRRSNNEDAFDVSAYEDNAAFQSDIPDDDIPEGFAEPAGSSVPAQDTQAEEPQEPAEDEYVCDECGAVINERVYGYSLNKFGRPLCIKCQRGGGNR